MLDIYGATGSVIIKDHYEVEFGGVSWKRLIQDPDDGEYYWCEDDEYWEEI